jgi:hypothetical protein
MDKYFDGEKLGILTLIKMLFNDISIIKLNRSLNNLDGYYDNYLSEFSESYEKKKTNAIRLFVRYANTSKAFKVVYLLDEYVDLLSKQAIEIRERRDTSNSVISIAIEETEKKMKEFLGSEYQN